MVRLRETVAVLCALGVALGPIPTGQVWASQLGSTQCAGGKIIQDSCANEASVAVKRDKPFVADRTLTVTANSVPTREYPELVARDSAGRIREEMDLHRFSPGGQSSFPTVALGGIPSSQNDLNISEVVAKREADANKSAVVVTILDCFGGTRMQFSLSNPAASLQRACRDQPAFQPSGQPYSDKLVRFLKTNNNPEAIVEDLGRKRIEGLQARGIRITWRGGEKDGEWRGKLARVWEEWMSDELGVTVLQVYSDRVKGAENR